jgi:hypothetical protein
VAGVVVISKIFRITKPPAGIISPHEGESWEAGTQKTIRWQINSHAKLITIEYSTDGGENWLYIHSGAQNKGKYAWTIPDCASNDCLIKIEEVT